MFLLFTIIAYAAEYYRMSCYRKSVLVCDLIVDAPLIGNIGVENPSALAAFKMVVLGNVEIEPVRSVGDKHLLYNALFCEKIQISVNRPTAYIRVDTADLQIYLLGGGMIFHCLNGMKHSISLDCVPGLHVAPRLSVTVTD